MFLPILLLASATSDLASQVPAAGPVDRASNAQTVIPIPCNPPSCLIERIQPPPPPPLPENLVMRATLERYRTCYSDRWEKARVQRFAAEKAVRESSPRPGSDQARAAALAYVRSRQALMGCIVDLEKASRALPLDGPDRVIIDKELRGMREGYFGQAKYETAILIGLLDKAASATEESYPYPYAGFF